MRTLRERLNRGLRAAASEARIEPASSAQAALDGSWRDILRSLLAVHVARSAQRVLEHQAEIPEAGRKSGAIRRFTTQGVYDLAKKTHLSFTQGAGHGGSHPHLAHEFLSALVEDRDPYPNAVKSANWTCVGLCAHESAMKGGKIVKLPAFTQG